MVIFHNTSADFVLISADVLLKIITMLKELRIAKLCSKNKWTLAGKLDKNASQLHSIFCRMGEGHMAGVFHKSDLLVDFQLYICGK